MIRKETKHYKALYFDIHINDLRNHYSESNPTGAYRKIKRFLEQHRFSHEQYSGYHSEYKTTDLEIFDLIREMNDIFPWLKYCVNNFEVSNIGANHNLLILFVEKMEEVLELK